MFDAITDEVRARLHDGRRGLETTFGPARSRRSLDRTVLSVLLVVGVLVLGFTWWKSSQSPELETVTSGTPKPTPLEATDREDVTGTGRTTVRVHVVGAVTSPGVYDLDSGARGADALAAAGGAATDADLARINLAAEVADGSQLFVPVIGEAPPPEVTTRDGTTTDAVNINTATLEELDTLPGVGEATAEKIIAHRDEHGPFDSVDALVDVSGIGERKLEELRDQATV